MIKKRAFALLIAVLFVWTLCAFSQAPTAQAASKTYSTADLMNALKSFEIALNDRWSYRYANKANYNKPIRELYKKIEAGISIDEFGVAIEKIVALGIDGHSRVRGYNWPTGACLPFLVETDDDRFIALQADRKSFLSEGFPFLVKVDGKPIQEWFEKITARVPKGSPQWIPHRCAVRFLGRLDYWRQEMGLPKKDSVSVELTNLSGTEFRVLNLPVATSPLSYPVWPPQTSKLLPGNVGYLRLPNMQKGPSTAEIRSWMPGFRDAAGLIIDVRDNDGGDRDALHLIYSYLASPNAAPRIFTAAAYRLHPSRKDDYLARGYRMFKEDSDQWNAQERAAIAAFKKTFNPAWELPKGQFSAWHYVVLRRNEDSSIYHFEKPVIVLMNAKCFSATDIFLAGLKGMKNVTLLGTPSGGGSGNSESLTLGNIPIMVTLSTMASFQATGKLFDGNGVYPDMLLHQVPEYYIGGRDNVLEKALEIIKVH